MLREAAYVNIEKELASVLVMLIMMTSLAGAFVVIPPQLPIDETVAIAPYGHHDYNRTMPAGRTVSIAISVLQGAPANRGEVVLLVVTDRQNYFLKMNGSHTYVSLLRLGAYSEASAVWQVPADGEYFFIIENPSAFNVTAGVKILYELEWLPLVDAAVALCGVLVASATVGYDAHRRKYAPLLVELRGDLDMVPSVVDHAPVRINYVVITEPSLKKCMVCNSVIGEEDPVLRCPHCGGLGHKDHFLQKVRVNGYCPACGKELNERDMQPKD